MAAFATLIQSVFLLFPNVVAVSDLNYTTYSSFIGLDEEQNITEINAVSFKPEFPNTTSTPESSSPEYPGTHASPTASPPSEPLPLSARLPSPLTDVSRICPCDEQRNSCDINCCCDNDCKEEVALFTNCSVDSVSGNKQLCSQLVVHYYLDRTVDGLSELHTSFQINPKNDIFCIQSQNCVDSFTYRSPAVPTSRNFDSLFKRFVDFPYRVTQNSAPLPTVEVLNSSGYQYGDVVDTSGEDGTRGIMSLPAAVNAQCFDASPAIFLKQQTSRCSRHLRVDRDCSALKALSMYAYTGIQLLSGKDKDAKIVPVEVTSIILKSLEGTESRLYMSENVEPVLVSQSVCLNAVLQVAFTVKYNQAGEIVNVTTDLILGPIRGDVRLLEQQFHLMFVQEDSKEMTSKHSGNPGYLTGLPIVSGTRTAEGIVQSIHPMATLTILQSTQDQDCLQGTHRHSPVLFGVEMMSGCALRVEESANCSLVSQVVLDILRGSRTYQYVAAFGTSPLNDPLDWVPIRKVSKPAAAQDAQSCSIPLSLHLEIEWTKYGSQENPQAQIMSVKEVLHTNTSNLASLSGGSGVIAVTSSVAFVPISAPAAPGVRASPSIDVKLPFDFFFPFV